MAEARPERPERSDRGFGERRSFDRAERSAPADAQPAERRRLAIQPRTTPVETLASPTQEAAVTSPSEPVKKPNPFGAARPADSKHQREIEEKAAQRTLAAATATTKSTPEKKEDSERRTDRPVYRPPVRQEGTGAPAKREGATYRKPGDRKEESAAHTPSPSGKAQVGPQAATQQRVKKEQQAAITNPFAALSMEDDDS